MTIKHWLTFVWIGLAAFALSSQSFAQRQTNSARQEGWVTVTRVKDGDTFEIAFEGGNVLNLTFSVRVRQIDTPEKNPRAQCPEEHALAQAATAFTARHLRPGTRVFLHEVGHDKYGGRILARVRLEDGRDLGALLIEQGYARPYNGEARGDWWCRHLRAR